MYGKLYMWVNIFYK